MVFLPFFPCLNIIYKIEKKTEQKQGQRHNILLSLKFKHFLRCNRGKYHHMENRLLAGIKMVQFVMMILLHFTNNNWYFVQLGPSPSQKDKTLVLDQSRTLKSSLNHHPPPPPPSKKHLRRFQGSYKPAFLCGH